MRARLLSLLLRPPPSLGLGMVVAASFAVAEALALYPLEAATRPAVKDAAHLVGVLVVSTVWGARLGVLTSVASAFTLSYFHIWPPRKPAIAERQNLEEFAFFIGAGLLISSVAALARSRAVAASERRRERALAVDLPNLMLGAGDVRSVLGTAAQRLAEVFALPSAAIELGVAAAGERRAAFPLRDGVTHLGTLLVRADVPEHTLAQLRQRVVPCLEALLRAALDRESIADSLNASREELSALLEQHVALRRVATLAAGGAPPTEVFDAVRTELGRLLNVDSTALIRYEPDGTASRVSGYNKLRGELLVDLHYPLDGDNVGGAVLRTGCAARMDSYDDAAGPAAEVIRGLGIRSSVGVPVVVEGRLWGAALVGSSKAEPIPPEAEDRLADFVELVATAIATAESRTQLTASRARIVAAADDARRRFERDLHDGAQQRLVSLGLELRMAQDSLPGEPKTAEQLLAHTAEGLAGVFEDLREIARGIHPAIVSKGGLGPALKTLARRSAVPVELNLNIDRRLPERVEVAAYYVVSEALANVAKHARASLVRVDVNAEAGILHISAQDDGIGGADLGKGSGLIGLQDRVETFGGRLEIVSPVGKGTTLLVEIPVEDA
ncbi:DUF4118 domain-containing protein [Dactylosporangium sp. NPDC005572]|uniref:sensor histidine kinase n=1 Tax=Dactylosporangium sp. NPDC005572 TaxID=3156889 RepID=UPI0033BB7DB5